MVDCSQFVGLLQETVGIRDVGTRIVEKIGVHNIQDQLASENLQLKMDLSSMKTENQSITTKLKETKDKVSCSVLRQSASRRTLEVVTGGHYTNTPATTRSTLPNLRTNRHWTSNCVTSNGSTVFAGSFLERQLYAYTFNNADEEWKTHMDLPGPLSCVFSSDNSCYLSIATKGIWMFNSGYSSSDTWRHITSFPEHKHITAGFVGFTMVANKKSIYLLGGFLDGHSLSTAFVCDIESRTWQSLPKMPFKSGCCSAVLLNNSLYAIGGFTTNKYQCFPVRQMAALPLNEPRWRRHQQLTFGGATVTPLHDSLIATGGRLGDGGDVNNVEMYFAKSDMWMPLSSMKTSRSWHGVCVTENNSLAAIGGAYSTDCEILNFH
jgi:hypothetical protein